MTMFMNGSCEVVGLDGRKNLQNIGSVTPGEVMDVQYSELITGLAATTLLTTAANDVANGSWPLRLAGNVFNPDNSRTVPKLRLDDAFDCVGVNRLGFSHAPHVNLLRTIQAIDAVPLLTKREALSKFTDAELDMTGIERSAQLYILKKIDFARMENVFGLRQLVAPVGIVAALLYATRDAANPVTRVLHDRFSLTGTKGVHATVQGILSQLPNLEKYLEREGSGRENAYWHIGESLRTPALAQEAKSPVPKFLGMIKGDIDTIGVLAK